MANYRQFKTNIPIDLFERISLAAARNGRPIGAEIKRVLEFAYPDPDFARLLRLYHEVSDTPSQLNG